jgi:signal transduction histidine kinase
MSEGATTVTDVSTEVWTVRRWQTLRGWITPHSFGINAFVFSTFCLITVGDVYVNGGTDGRNANVIAYVLLVGQTLPLAFRVRYPLGSMYLVCVSIMLYWVIDYPLGFDGAAFIAIYSGAAHGRSRRRAWRHVGLVTVAVTVSLEQEDNPAIVAIGFSSIHIAAALLGEVVYQRRQRIADLEQRAREAEEALELRAQVAVADERQRIAREMHDVVAHGMSVILVQAAAAQQIAHTDPDKTVEVLGNIEHVGRDSLTELRRMLGVLRNVGQPDVGLTPQPGLADVADAVEQSVVAGLPTELVVSGTPLDLPAGVELAVYRIVQEALTNARKHAGQSASASVRLSFGDESITVEVSDDGAGAMSALAATGAGNGLVGMRERVEIYGGELSARPLPGGGFSVYATLPIRSPITRPSVASAASTNYEEIT